MAAIRGYMAASIDGYIADTAGGYSFLGRYDGVEYGFADFFAGIGTCVWGRVTWEQSLNTPGQEWPFAGKRHVVVSRNPVSAAPGPHPAERWDRGVDRALVDHLRGATTAGDVWVLGGGQLQGALFELDAIDRIELAIIPVILGDGIPMFPKSRPREQWMTLAGIRRFEPDALILDYRRPR